MSKGGCKLQSVPEREAQLLRKGFDEFDKIESKRDELKEKFKGKIIATKDGEIIASAEDIKELEKKVREKGENLETVYTHSFLPEEIRIFL